jgi:antitoxin ParD1/3/4
LARIANVPKLEAEATDMETMNIALPETLKEYVQKRVASGEFSSNSEYIRELIRLDQRQAAQSRLEAELLKGLASGPSKKMTSHEWQELRDRVLKTGKRRSG